MTSQITDDTGRYIVLERVRDGKGVQSADGPIVLNAGLQILARSTGVGSGRHLGTTQMFPDRTPQQHELEPAFAQTGALLFRNVVGGYAAIRLRWRPEGAADSNSRWFSESCTVMLPDARFPQDIPPGFFAWCVRTLEVEPEMRTAADVSLVREMPPLSVRFPPVSRPTAETLRGWPAWRLERITAVVEMLERRLPGICGLGEPMDPATAADLFAEELDLLFAFGLRNEETALDLLPPISIGFRPAAQQGWVSLCTEEMAAAPGVSGLRERVDHLLRHGFAPVDAADAATLTAEPAGRAAPPVYIRSDGRRIGVGRRTFVPHPAPGGPAA